MMHSNFGMQPAGPLSMAFPQDALFNDLSRQMALSQANRRLSRSSNGQRSGNAMRVAKPTSASNSPRSSTIMARRRTLMNDGNAQRRRQQAVEQASLYYGNDLGQPIKRQERPVSWHPSSYGQPLLQAPPPQSYYSLSTSDMYADQQDMYTAYPQFSPMLASYSCNASPSASFSPLGLPFQTTDSLQYLPVDSHVSALPPTSVYAPSACNQYAPDVHTTPDDGVGNATSAGWDWNTFVMHGFNATTPPTPETYPQAELAQPVMSEESLPFDALDEPEEEGEILVGMGLYDTPDKYEEDPQLNNYRSTVSSLLGATFRSQEPKGKGLKLEETWEPPKSDDKEEEEEDEEDEDETESEVKKQG